MKMSLRHPLVLRLTIIRTPSQLGSTAQYCCKISTSLTNWPISTEKESPKELSMPRELALTVTSSALPTARSGPRPNPSRPWVNERPYSQGFRLSEAKRDRRTLSETHGDLLSNSIPKKATGTWLGTTLLFSSSGTPRNSPTSSTLRRGTPKRT